MDYTTPQGGCTYYANPQPHAVRKQTNGSSVETYCYDADGNMASGAGGATYSWTSYNLPSYFNNGSAGNSQFYYNGNHQRYKQVASYAGSVETTTYVGGLMQKVITSAATSYRHYIPAGSNTVLYTRMSTGSNPTYYITKDHLGSTSVISDSSGAAVLSENFSAAGLNRSANWAAYIAAADLTNIGNYTHQGFTGQEAANNLYLLNLNGRMLNNSTWRMLSPDPYVPNPGNTQSFNRYSYVNNNPLSFIDPSGFDDLDPITVIGTPIVDGAGDLFGAIGSFFGGLFGGGGSHLSASQQAAQAHGINLSKSLPQYAGGSFQADAVNTFSVYQDVGATYGIDPNDVRLGVTPLAADPSVENEIDGATVTASRANPGDFNFAGIGRSPDFTAYNGAMNVAAAGVLLSANFMLGGAPATAAGVTRGPAASLALAQQIANAGTKAPWARTVALLETAEGPTLVGAGATDLNAAQKLLATELGFTVAQDMAGFDAEMTVLNSAGQLGLTPTTGVATNIVCSFCASQITEFGGWVNGRFFGFGGP